MQQWATAAAKEQTTTNCAAVYFLTKEKLSRRRTITR